MGRQPLGSIDVDIRVFPEGDLLEGARIGSKQETVFCRPSQKAGEDKKC